MKFSDIPGHAKVKDHLRNLVDDNNMPHALLLEGPAGIGKFSLARALAQYIHCENRTDGEPCGHCDACVQHQSLNHIDTHYVYPVVKLEKMNTPPVSGDFFTEWKEYLAENPYMSFDRWTAGFDKKNAQPIIYVTESAELIRILSYTTHGSRYKIVLLWLPEKMNEECANKLLKLIEEPFEDTIFIMTSDNPAAILPTIYSRLRRVEMKRLSDADIAGYLEHHYSVDRQEAMATAHIAEGSVIAAEENIAMSGDRKEFFDMFIQLMRLAYQRKVKELREWGNTLAGWGREREIKFYEYSQRLVRENFIYNFAIPDLNYLNREEASFSVNFARFINERNAEKLIEVMNRAMTDIAGNANGKIVNLDTAIKIIFLLKQ